MKPIRLSLIALAALAVCLPSAARQDKPDKPDQKAQEKIYDEAADAREQIADALAAAKKENRRVLIQWGANWCGWCHLLHDLYKSNREVSRKLLYEYDVVLIDIGRFNKNMDLAEKYGADLKGNGVPYLTVLDADGDVLANQETGSLEAKIDGKNGHDPKKVMAFLEKYQAPYLSAESILADGIAEANSEGKHVYIHFGAPWCPWCHRLEDWLAQDDVAKVMGKHFVDVKIDQDRTIGGADMLHTMAESSRTGIPWSAVLDEKGEVLAGSFEGERQNIGYPVTEEDITAFLAMLSKGAPDLTDAEKDALAESIRKARPEKH